MIALSTIDRSGRDDEFAREMIQAQAALRRFALQLTRNEAARDDLVQDTLLRAWTARNRFVAGTNLKAWLFRIARNGFVSGLRRSWRQVAMAEEDIARRLTAPPAQETSLYLRDVQRAIDSLPPHQSRALRAINDAGGDYEAVARDLGIPNGTLKSRVSRAREAAVAFIDRPSTPESVGHRPSPEPRHVREDGSSRRREDAYGQWKASGQRLIG